MVFIFPIFFISLIIRNNNYKLYNLIFFFKIVIRRRFMQRIQQPIYRREETFFNRFLELKLINYVTIIIANFRPYFVHLDPELLTHHYTIID